jgi:hypothetical protein
MGTPPPSYNALESAMADDKRIRNERLETASDALLWRRWQAACAAADAAEGGEDVLDFMALAALAEGRLDGGEDDGTERAALDRALALDPALIDDVAAARDLAVRLDALPAADPRAIGRAAALVSPMPAVAAAAGGRRQSAEIHAFRPRSAKGGAQRRTFSVGYAVRWAALAASLAFMGYFGFALGSDAYSSLISADSTGQGGSGGSLIELMDPPTGIFNGISEVAGA